VAFSVALLLEPFGEAMDLDHVRIEHLNDRWNILLGANVLVSRKVQNEIVSRLRLQQPLGCGAAIVDRQQPEFTANQRLRARAEVADQFDEAVFGKVDDVNGGRGVREKQLERGAADASGAAGYQDAPAGDGRPELGIVRFSAKSEVVRRLNSGSKNRDPVSIKPLPEKAFIACPILAKGGRSDSRLGGPSGGLPFATFPSARALFKVIGVHSARS
jgi:hypothetical protein